MPIRVHLLAKELGLNSKDLIKKLRSIKVKVKGHMSSLDDETAEIIRRELKSAPPKAKKKVTAVARKGKTKEVAKKEKQKKVSTPIVKEKEKKSPPVIETVSFETKKPKEVKKVPTPVIETVSFEAGKPKEVEKVPIAELRTVEIGFPMTIKLFSAKIGIKANELIAKLIKKNIFATINQNIDEGIANEIAASYGYKIKKPESLEEKLMKVEAEDEAKVKSGTVSRSPVVTFMGHVDHGKTSLLDYIRKTKVTAKEKGGITQHIGAYRVSLDKRSVTFLDTPGHEAFTAMRARGANATDIVVLVVAADDGIMPQTKEAIDHARAANVPIVVAVNKCDLPNISLDKVKRQLSEQELMSEDWGGKTIVVPVSAKTGQGVDNLLEMLLLEAELLELKANPLIRARGVVIEGKLSPGQGVVTTLLVKNGTLRVGDTILSGLYYGKIKAMMNDMGDRVTEAPPSTPVEVLGVSGLPEAGDEFFVVKDEKKARTLSTLKQEEKRHRELNKDQRISLEHLYEQIKAGGIKELKIVLKADVQGSVEALQKSLEDLSTKEVQLKAVHVGVGNINESDVMLAVVSNAIIIGFHVKIDPKADEISRKESVDVKRYDVIYEAINDVQAAMEGLLEPITKETVQGRAKVQQVFKVSKIGFVAGCLVMKGTISRSNPVRLIRAGEEIYRGKIRSLKRFKDDVKDVNEGIECGIALENHRDVKAGDIVESFIIEKIARRMSKRK